jgi:hypothetical protein
VRLREAQEEEARAQAEAAQEELERELLQLRWEVKKLKLEHELWLFDQKYSPSQPRVPAGSREGGRWIGAFTLPNQQTVENTTSRPTVLAQSDFGTLVAEIPVPGGRRCVYNFGRISVVAPGPTNFRCSRTMHWSGVVHGRLLNDN